MIPSAQATTPAVLPHRRMVVAGDHCLHRAGLAGLLRIQESIAVLADCAIGPECLEFLRTSEPDLVLIEFSRPQRPESAGIAFIRQAVAHAPRCRVAVVGGRCEEHFVAAALAAGAQGFFSRDSAPQELLNGLERICSGRRHLTAEAAKFAVEALVGLTRGTQSSPASRLSPREREVLARIAEGMTSGQIAREMLVSIHTVDTHRRNLMTKLGLHSLAAVIKFGIEQGLPTR